MNAHTTIGKMAMFLPDTAARAAMASAGQGQSAQRIFSSTSMGAPAHPATPIGIGVGSVSFMPSNAAPPTAVAGRPTKMRRLDPRKQVILEKNPRIGIHYCVEIDGDAGVGELCFLNTETAGGWTHPKLVTLTQLYKEFQENGFEKIRKIAANPVGVFNTDVMDVKGGYSGTHVTIDTQRYTSVRDYWPIDARAGDRLWLIFVENGDEKKLHALSARGYEQAKASLPDDQQGKEKLCICVGVVQNRLPADPLFGSASKRCKFDPTKEYARAREIHLCLNGNVW